MPRIALFFTLFIGVYGEFECPKYDNGTCLEGQFPNTETCDRFYECVFCQTLEGTCPDGQTFDPFQNSCIEIADTWCGVEETVFSVAKYDAEFGPVNPLILRKILLNYGSDYSTATGDYTAPRNGTYFFHLSAGVDNGTQAIVNINGLPFPAGVYRNSTAITGEVISRSTIAPLTPGQTVNLNLEEGTSVQGATNHRTLWTGFRLEDFTFSETICAFSASRSTSFDTNNGFVPFDQRHLNCGGNLSPTGAFIAPVNGYYFVSFSTGIRSDEGARVEFVYEGNTISEVWRSQRSESGSDIDTISKSIMVLMLEGESLGIRLGFGELVPSPVPEDTLLSFSGFLYQPELLLNSGCWSLYANEEQTGPLDVLLFQNQDVEFAVDYSAGRLYPSADGFYHVSISIGVAQNSAMEAQLVRTTIEGDESVIADLYKNFDNSPFTYFDTLTRSITVYLADGDNLSIRIPGNYTVYSSERQQTSFSGFHLERFTPPPSSVSQR